MKGALVDELKIDSEEMRLYQQEWLILEVTELIGSLMEEKNIKKKDLADRLDRSKGYITQLLDGRANMTLRTVADVMWALDASLAVSAYPLGFESSFESSEICDFTSMRTSWSQHSIKLVPVRQCEFIEDDIKEQYKLTG